MTTANLARLLSRGLLLSALSAGVALAQTSSPRNTVERTVDGPTPPSKTISRAHQPIGTPHKASALAPRRTNQRVFGDPIQAPIVHNAPPKKPSAPK
jgi:hypothetical protein